MRISILTLFLFFHFGVFGQVSGVVNSYHKVITISSTSTSETITLDNTTGLADFDKVVIIQMKGAVVSTANDNTYGSISSSGLGNAGNYEIATICKVNSNNTVTLVHKLLNTYTTSGKVQLVKIARYETVTVDGQLLAGNWVNSTGKGGVLAVMADELILNAPVSADGKGYSGGRYMITNGGYCFDNRFTRFSYDPTPYTESSFFLSYPNTQAGAYKGESITDPILAQQGGKGAMATGGGGGNNHNTAGGGGGHIGAGGMGGDNTTTSACKSIHPGIGGYALNFSASRLFMGGGGGAGHGDNTPEAGYGGGNGGGIIFLLVNKLTSNGYSISANGSAGLNTGGDGASGGGAGGAVVLNVSTFTDPPNVTAKGGNGGSVDNDGYPDRCKGEGGGGGGGAIYFRGAVQGTTSVAGGAKGALILSPGCSEPRVAKNGDNGGIYPNYTYKESINVLSSCPEWSGLPVNLLYFKATSKGSRVIAEWSVGNPEDALHYVVQRRATSTSWQNVLTVPAESSTTLFKKEDGPLASGIYFYRLRIVEKNRDVHYSPVQQITIKSEDVNRLVIYPNPSSQLLHIILPSKKDGELHIYDLNGKLVYRKKITATATLIKQDISFLSEGAYMVQVGKLTAGFVVVK